MIKRSQILFILVFYAIGLAGQIPFKITNYNSKHGLSNSSIYDIVKDKNGFLWISTELGINKFDGTNFIKYTPKTHDLPDNTITNSALVGDSALFFATGTSGYFTFNTKTETVNLCNVKNPSFLHKSHNIKVREDKAYIISLLDNSISIYDLRTNKFTDTISFNHKKIYEFDFDEHGILVAATEEGLKKYTNKTLVPYQFDQNFPLTQSPIYSINISKNKTYFSTGTTLFVYDKNKHRISDSIKYSTTDKGIGELFIDKQGNAWFNTLYLSELYYYDFKNKQLTNFEPFVEGNANSITCITEDDEDNIWIGSYTTGLYKISPSVFTIIPNLLNSNVYKLEVIDSSRYIIAVKNGLNILDRTTNVLTGLKFDQQDKDYIYDLELFGRNVLVTNQFHNNRTLKNGGTDFIFVKGRASCLINDTLILLGSWLNNIYLSHIKNGKSIILKDIILKDNIEKKRRINCFCKDSNAQVWCGTDYGLYVASLTNIENFVRINEPLLNTQILDVVERKKNEIYIATNNGLYTLNNNKLILINQLNNQSIEKINSFCLDKNGNLFIGTLNGLFVIHPDNSSEYFSIEDGLSSNEINKIIYNRFNNSLIIGTNIGFCELNLNLSRDHEKRIPRLHYDHINSTGKITFSKGVFELENRNVNIYFSGICFSRANSLSYKWVMDNGSSHFIVNPSIELAAMNYGMHTIKIYATNDGKNWSKPIEINLLVKTPFYFTLWFLIFAGIVFCFLVWLYLRYWIRKIRLSEHKKTEIEQKLISLKYEALNASINPHFIFNALNSVQHYINTNRNDEASDYLAKFGHLIRQALESADAHFISLEQEKQRLCLYAELEQLRFDNSFTFDFTIEETINMSETKIPNMILQPLIENSIIHGFKQIDYKGALSVRIFDEVDSLKIIISDNGRGFIENKNNNSNGKTKSIGMNNVRERLAVIPGAVFNLYNKADYSEEQGVIIEIILPLIYQ